jgi:threonine synthase
MGLPMNKIICALNENIAFLDFLKTGTYTARATVNSPSTAMMVGHANNLARAVDFYGGHMYDLVDKDGKVVKGGQGLIDVKPDLTAMNRDIWAMSVSNDAHYAAMKEAYEKYGVLLDPHGAVGYDALSRCLHEFGLLSVIYETAAPGKFPDIVQKATGVTPPIPEGMQKQATLRERIYDMVAEPDLQDVPGKTEKVKKLSSGQIEEAKATIRSIYSAQ